MPVIVRASEVLPCGSIQYDDPLLSLMYATSSCRVLKIEKPVWGLFNVCQPEVTSWKRPTMGEFTLVSL
ncbi:hypothetical protein ACFXCZ_35110 [Streptomyces sp. NPDC059396]|uniref:hypothetical protein n=1 Tax=Streptomyces sp. NPDC059396 TaxID=3346819 RepID=UPI003691A508